MSGVLCRAEDEAPGGSLKPQVTHQTLHGAASHREPFPTQLTPHLPCPIHPIVVLPHPADLRTQLGVTAGPHRPPPGLGLETFVFVVRRRGDRHNTADRLDPIHVPVIVDEPDHRLGRRSSSACAKYADAFRRISFARRSSLTSRRNVVSSSTWDDVNPGLRLPSRSACRTQFRNVSDEHPTLSAMERIAAHCESYPPSWSSTIRTARSRTSGAYLFGFPMTPSSQGSEPPENPGWFKALQ